MYDVRSMKIMILCMCLDELIFFYDRFAALRLFNQLLILLLLGPLTLPLTPPFVTIRRCISKPTSYNALITKRSSVRCCCFICSRFLLNTSTLFDNCTIVSSFFKIFSFKLCAATLYFIFVAFVICLAILCCPLLCFGSLS